jgi:hypothetical protein
VEFLELLHQGSHVRAHGRHAAVLVERAFLELVNPGEPLAKGFERGLLLVQRRHRRPQVSGLFLEALELLPQRRHVAIAREQVVGDLLDRRQAGLASETRWSNASSWRRSVSRCSL